MQNLKIHPTHSNYICNPATGEYSFIYIKNERNLDTKEFKIVQKYKWKKGHLSDAGYYIGTFNKKGFGIHRFIWECVNGVITDSREIDHINSNKLDNRIENLQLLTIGENRKKAYTKRTDNMGATAHENKKQIKAISLETKDELTFKSKYACAKFLKISPAMIYLIVQGRAKTANCETGKYTFEVID